MPVLTALRARISLRGSPYSTERPPHILCRRNHGRSIPAILRAFKPLLPQCESKAEGNGIGAGWLARRRGAQGFIVQQAAELKGASPVQVVAVEEILIRKARI